MYIVIAMLLGGILGGLVSHNKGRNIFFWTLLCGIMPLCLLILLVLPTLAQQGISRSCPFCMRIIPWQASICSFCRQRVPAPQRELCAFCGSEYEQGKNSCPHCGK